MYIEDQSQCHPIKGLKLRTSLQAARVCHSGLILPNPHRLSRLLSEYTGPLTQHISTCFNPFRLPDTVRDFRAVPTAVAAPVPCSLWAGESLILYFFITGTCMVLLFIQCCTTTQIVNRLSSPGRKHTYMIL